MGRGAQWERWGAGRKALRPMRRAGRRARYPMGKAGRAGRKAGRPVRGVGRGARCPMGKAEGGGTSARGGAAGVARGPGSSQGSGCWPRRPAPLSSARPGGPVGARRDGGRRVRAVPGGHLHSHVRRLHAVLLQPQNLLVRHARRHGRGAAGQRRPG